MTTPFGMALVAAMALLMAAPSAAALEVTGPTLPDPPVVPCPLIEREHTDIVHGPDDMVHDAADVACDLVNAFVEEAWETIHIGWDLTWTEVEIIIEFIDPFIDSAQDNACDVVYGPDHDQEDLGCCEVQVDLQDPLAERPCHV